MAKGRMMQAQDKTQFAELMLGVAEYYGRKISTTLVEMYWQGLAKYDLAAVRDAMNRHVANSESGEFFPKIVDITRILDGSHKDRAQVAWAKVDRAVRTVGPYESVVFDDPLVHCAISDMGGWVHLCGKGDDEWPFVAREFENRYRGYMARGDYEHDVPKLVGMAEQHNEALGANVRTIPQLVGDKAKARRTLEQISGLPEMYRLAQGDSK